ncbi:Protein CBG27646 [Caenorhabditis briggsae]|uniref:Uncharacterized protein n=2 Tax=Caenorhabditis briggsae TaxID=6238 RepID=A0AAE8ZRW6_CAEBR|nr:Protein CBG27646 [Caenorhabditis briggsae]ULT81858.1 hypothetical protein L3Y34_011664 [Caenorhabditis briggsae]UMM41164.1 hypothetical protein L5515_017543 [Caenorhabditis briggsae]CAR99925.1 Protein CBG27646 [Caenorhabditis briggsae]
MLSNSTAPKRSSRKDRCRRRVSRFFSTVKRVFSIKTKEAAHPLLADTPMIPGAPKPRRATMAYARFQPLCDRLPISPEYFIRPEAFMAQPSNTVSLNVSLSLNDPSVDSTGNSSDVIVIFCFCLFSMSVLLAITIISYF